MSDPPDVFCLYLGNGHLLQDASGQVLEYLSPAVAAYYAREECTDEVSVVQVEPDGTMWHVETQAHINTRLTEPSDEHADA